MTFDRKSYMKEYNKKYREDNKEELKEYFKLYYIENRAEKLAYSRKRSAEVSLFVAEQKSGKCCEMCGLETPSDALVFHHIDPKEKSTTVSRCSSVELAREEIKKCALLCARCHRIVHVDEDPRNPDVHWERRIRDNILFVRRAKRFLGCSVCGYKNMGVALDFHHVIGEKFDAVANLTHGPREILKEEMRKCIVLCANCHAIETAEERRRKR